MGRVQKSFQLSCGYTPGHSCLKCPFHDCIARADYRISVEERIMTACGHNEVVGKQEVKPYGELTKTVILKSREEIYTNGLRVYYRSVEVIDKELAEEFGAKFESERRWNNLLKNNIDYHCNSDEERQGNSIEYRRTSRAIA